MKDSYQGDNSYAKRMKSTAKSKEDILIPCLKENYKLLDYGSGPSDFIYQLCKKHKTDYVALDKSPYVQMELEKQGITCVSELDENKYAECFDVIFLSSVYHEILSFLAPIDVAKTLSNICNCLKPGGVLVFRDWVTLPAEGTEVAIDIVEDKVSEVAIWMNVLKQNSIIKNNVAFNESTLLVKGDDVICDLYEIVYHVVWGLPSLERESRERYHFVENDWKHLSNNLGLSLESYEVFMDTSYYEYIGRYIKNYQELEIPASKEVRVYRK